VAGVASTIAPRHSRLLEFEREWRAHNAAKEDAIRREFSLSPARYYQLLDVVIDSPAAVRYDPMLVGQLQRSRAARSSARSSRTSTTEILEGERIRPHTEETRD
jgi:hypothetical protein